jgi:filamentous hemagglutinin family protein
MTKSALGYLRRQYLCVLRRCAWLNAAAAGAALAVAAPGALAQTIVTDGRTQTQLTVNGSVTDITTQTVRGPNAYNAFSRFDVNQGATVNLHLPGATANLLNLVTDQRSYINGLVNSYKNGAIGGNVYFFNPLGVVVGQGGVINTGSLTLASPTPGFMNQLMDPSGTIGDAATQQALNGQVPLSASGLISVQGQINAVDELTLAGGNVDVGAAAALLAGGSAQVAFGELVNVQGAQQAAGVSMDGGVIRIVAAQDISVAGQVSADGMGGQSDGGHVLVMAERDATLKAGAVVSANAGTTGDGGAVEFSAKDTVHLAGGRLQARATQGVAGTVLIDPENVSVDADLLRSSGGNADGAGTTWDAGSLTIQADKNLTLADGVVISTRQVAAQTRAAHISSASTGDSGDLSLKAAHINLGTDAMLLADTESGSLYKAGNVSVKATDINAVGAVRSASADIKGTHVTIRGKDIMLSATADTSLVAQLLETAPATTLADAQTYLNNELDNLSDGPGGEYLAITTDANAKTELYGAQIKGSGEVSITAFAGARAGFNKQATADVIVGDQIAANGTTVLSSSRIEGQTLNISSAADTSLTYNVIGSALKLLDQSWLPDPDSGLIPLLDDQLFDFSSVPLVSLSTAKAHVDVSGASTLIAGDALTIASSATSAAKPSFASPLLFSAAWGESTSEARTLIGGTTQLVSTGKTGLTADTDVEMEVTASVDSKNKPVDAVFARAENTTVTTVEVGDSTRVDAGSVDAKASTAVDVSLSADAKNTGGSGLGLALAINESSNTTSARLGGDVTASTGGVNVDATIDVAGNGTSANAATLGKPGFIAKNITNPLAQMKQNASNGLLNATGKLKPGTSSRISSFLFPLVKEGKFNVSGAVAYSDSINTATAYVAPQAKVKAEGHLSVTSNITDGPSASAGAKSSSTGTALGGSAVIANFANKANAYLGQGSTVDAKGALLVDANTHVPYPWQINWNSPEEILDFLQGGVLDMVLTSYAINSSSGGSGVGISAAVSVFGIDNDAEAWIDEGAKVNTVFDKDTLALPNQSVTVSAKNDINTVNAVGILSTKKFFGTGGAKAAVGGSANFIDIAEDASATIRGDAQVKSATTIDVKAENRNELVTVTEAGGKSDNIGIEGAVSVNTLEGHATAAIDDDAQISSGGNVDLAATSSLQNITVAGGVVATKGQAGIGFAVSLNNIQTSADAYIGNYDPLGLDTVSATGAVKSDGDVNLSASSLTEIGAYSISGAIATESKAQTDVPGDAQSTKSAGGGAGQGKFGIAVSGDASVNDIQANTRAYLSDGAKVTQAKDAKLEAHNTLAINALAGAVTVSSQSNGNGLAGSYAQNTLAGTTAAYLDDASLTLSGDLGLDAQVNGKIRTLSASVEATKGKVGVAGSVSVNEIDNLTQTYLRSSTVLGAQSAQLLAQDTSAIHAIAGAAAFAGGKGGIGLAFAWNQIGNTTKSFVDSSSITASGDVDLSADSKNEIKTIAAALGVSKGGMAGAGAVALNSIDNTAAAHATNSALTSNGGQTALDATDTSTIFSVSGGAAVSGGQAAVGVSVSVNDINNTTEAAADGGALKGRSVALGAREAADIQAIAVGAGGGARNAITGSLGINTIGNTTKASSTGAALIATAGDTSLQASDVSTITSVTGAAAVGGSNAVGASGSYNHIGGSVKAEVSGGSASGTHVLVDADRAGTLDVWAISGSAAGTTGVAGSIALNDAGGSTTARVGEGAIVGASGNAVVSAEADDFIKSRAGAVGLGGSVGGAGAIAFNDIHADTKAEVTGPGTQVTATGLSAAAQIDNGQLAGGGQLKARQQKDAVRGVAVVASSTAEVENVALSAAGGGSAAVAATVSIAMLGGSTKAEVTQGAQLNAVLGGSEQEARVAAYHHDTITSGTGGGAVGGDAGVGGAADTAVVSHLTRARVDSAQAQAVQAVAVDAGSTTDITQAVVAVGGGVYAGLAGTVGVVLVDGTTEALAQDAQLDSGGTLNVNATSDADVDLTAGALAVSGVAGVGITAAVTVVEQQTQARVNGSSALNAQGATDIQAASTFEQKNDAYTAAAAGGVGVAGTVNVVVVKGSTEADVGAGVTVNDTARGIGQDVAITASDDSRVTNRVGSLGVGGTAGVGAVADVTLIHNGASASVASGARVRADRDVTVSAKTVRDVDSTATALAGGYTAGIAGAVSVISVGARPEGDAKDNSTGSVGKAGEMASASATGDQMGSEGSASASRADSARSGIQLSGDLDTAPVNTTAAATVATGATIIAGRHVAVGAHNQTDTDAQAIGAAASAGFSIGGGIAIATVNDKTLASLNGSTTAGGNIRVSALDDQPDASVLVTAAGGAGLAGLAASFALHDKSSTADATLGGNVTALTGLVTVDAGIDHNLKAQGVAAAVGVVGVGASIAHVVENSAATAGVSAGATIQARSLDVYGHGQTDSVADVIAASGGLISGAGADADVQDTSRAQALVGDNANITTTAATADATRVRADVDPLARSNAVGVAVAVGVGIGVSMADAQVNTTARAATGSGVKVSTNALSVQAQTLQHGLTAQSDAKAAGGGLLVGVSATESNAGAKTLTESAVGSDNVLTVAGDLTVGADSTTSVDADVTGLAFGGYLAQGSNTARANTDTQTTATVGNNPAINAGAVRVTADGNDQLKANTLAGAGGLGVAVASLGETTAKSRTYARLGGTTGVTGEVNAALVNVAAAQHTAFDTHADSTSASAVGFSGARAINLVNTDTQATLGQNLLIKTQDLSALAWNDIVKAGTGYDVDSGSGGLLNGAAALSKSTINNSAKVNVEKRARIEVDVAGDNAGKTTLAARNDVQAKDTVRLDSGGAIAIAKAESVLKSDNNLAQVNVGDGAEIFSDGDIHLSARAKVALNANARSKTYGLAGASQGASTASIGANNQVNIGANATLQSDGESVNLLAGTDGSQSNDLNANADTRLWNYTALPVENDPQADARIVQHNTINVAAGAQVRAVKDVSLRATEGRHTTRGFGEGTDAYRETLSAIGEFFGADTSSLKITGGSTYDNATAFGGLDPASGVNVDGTVQSGIWHHQFLTLAADGVTVTTSEDMADKYRFRDNVNLATELADEIAALKTKADQVRAAANSYSGTDAADAADALDNDARILQAQLDQLNASPLVGFIDILDATARSGNVNITGKYLTGAATGHIEAPGDVRIDIENQSKRFMQTSKLTIPDEGGGRVSFNGLSVDSVAAINERNSLTKKGGFGATVVSALSSAAPVIRVENTNSNDIAGLDSPAQLWMRGDVTNLGGEAVAKSHGTLRVSAKINAETVNIATGGDFIQTYTPGFTHQGGNPIAQLGNLPDNREAAKVDYSTNNLAARTCTSDPKSCSSTIAGNNVYISGQKLNINGLIQAGLPDRAMLIDSTLVGGANAGKISTARAAWLASPDTATRYLELNNPAPESSAIKVRYDAQYDRLELDNVRMGGGHMELFGNIFSTGNGELRVMDGYGRINVTNTTGYDLAVGRLDTGPGVEGLIRITDTSQRDPLNKPLVTEITRLGNTIETRTSQTVDAEGKPTNLVASSTGRNTSFKPLANRRFNWINGERTQTDEDRVYTTRVLFGVDFLWPDSDPPDTTTTSNVYTARLTGDWLSVGGGSADYAMDYSRYSSGTYKYKADSTTRDGVLCIDGACAKEDITTHKYFRTVVNEYYQHSLNASKDVAVTFTGFDANGAQLSVDAGSGQLLLGGLVRGLTGDTTLNGGAGIQQLNDDARIVASDLTLTSANGSIGGALTVSQGAVGSENKAISIDLTEAGEGLSNGTVSAIGRAGVALKEIGGDLRVREATASNGDVTLIADRNLLETLPGTVVTGNNIHLVALSGGIGDALDPFRIETQGDVSTLSARAANDIHLTEQTGDLRVVDVESQAGDVALAAPGRLLDANTVETVDEYAKADLLNLWKEMALTGGQADTALDRSLAAQKDALQKSYESYFRMRRLHRNDDGSYTADAYRADYTFETTPNQASALKAANGWNDADIAKYEASQTQAYHASHARFGGGDYVVGFAPNLTSAETAALSKGHQWSDAQLANAISAGLLKETSDTNIRIEDPNVTGRTVSLTAGGSIGADLGDVVITKGTAFDSLSDAQKLVLLTAERNDLTVTDSEITIARHEDFNVTAEVALNATAGGNLYVSSEQSLTVDQVQAVGEARIKTSETLGAVAGKSHVLADSIVLEAGKGDVGSAGTPMVVDLGAGKLTARAGRNIYIQEVTGDMVIESVFAKGNATLVADGSILEAQTDRSIDVRADNIDLTAGDTIGQSGGDRSLDVAVDADGTINASAPNGVYLNSTGGAGGLGNITTAGRFEFSVDQGSIDVNGVVSADAGVVLGASDHVNFAGGQVRSDNDVTLNGGTDGSGSVQGDGNGVADVVAGGPVTIVAANDIGGASPLQVDVAEVITLRATSIDAQVSPLTAGDALSVTATGPIGDVAQNVNLNFKRAGPVVFPTLVLHNGMVRTDGADLSVMNGYLGDAVTFVTPFFGARIDHIVRSTTPGLDVRAFTLDNDFSLTMTAGGVLLNDLIINQDLLRNIVGTPSGVADVLSTQSLQTLRRQLPSEGELTEPSALPEDDKPLVDVDQYSMADLPADSDLKAP